MKKITSISIMYALMFTIALCTNAQQASKGEKENGPTGDLPPITPYHVNIRAMRDFMQSFKNAIEINWYKVSDGFIVYFTDNGIRSISAYNRGGTWLYNLRTYFENNLSRDIRARVKSIYYDYSINAINEITTTDEVIYIVQVEDKSCVKFLRVIKGEEIEEVKQLNKN